MPIGISRPHMDEDVEMALASLPRIETALDLGCGLGKLGKIVRKLIPNLDLTGVDANPEIIKTLQQKEHAYTTLENLPLRKVMERSQQIDLVIAGDVLEHLPKDELVRVLNLIREKALYALIIGPEQDESSLDNSTELRKDLPPWEHHLSILRPQEIAELLGKGIYFRRRATTNQKGENPYDKFCLLTQCEPLSYFHPLPHTKSNSVSTVL